MMNKLMIFLKYAFPFLSVLFLWRLSAPFWNPSGIIAIIPIFYYSFIRPTNWFAPFAAVFCFLIDYRFDTLFFWTAIYCIFYAANGFQNFVDLTRQKSDGLLVFASYFGVAAFILAISGFTFFGFIRAIWLTLWLSILYIPFVALAKKINDD